MNQGHYFDVLHWLIGPVDKILQPLVKAQYRSRRYQLKKWKDGTLDLLVLQCLLTRKI